MAEKKSTTSSGKVHGKPGPKVTRKFPRSKNGEFSINLFPKDKPDPEDMDVVDATTDGHVDEAEVASVSGDPVHSRYPSPKKCKEFTSKWRQLIGGVVSRDNFKMGHLYQLEILCDLYVEYGALSKFVRIKGHTYTSVGRNGKDIKTYPQVSLMFRTQAEIRSYSKMLGLIMTPDKSSTSGGEASEWA
jgi:hypothetical protein